MTNYKENYIKAKAGRIHAEEILNALEKTREKLEESMNEIDERIDEVVKEKEILRGLNKNFSHIPFPLGSNETQITHRRTDNRR